MYSRKIIVLLVIITLFSTSLAGQTEGKFASPDFYKDKEKEEKSIARAYMYSLAIPGWGQHYLGDKVKARAFFIGEGVIWSLFTSFFTYGEWQKSKYKNWAARYAGVDNEGKSDYFYDVIKKYQSRDYYNWVTYLLEEDRSLLYPEREEWYWKWQSEDKRKRFKQILLSSIQAKKNAKLCIGAAILNRLLSILDLYRQYKFSAPSDEFSIRLTPDSYKPAKLNWRLVYTYHF